MSASRASCLLALCLFAVSAQAQPARYALDAESRLWLDGSATTGPFTCETTAIQGAGQMASGAAPRVVLTVPTRSLDCGHRRMNADLYDALAAEAHPHIGFTLLRVDSLALHPDISWQGVHVVGLLTLAGAAREVSVPIQWRHRTDGAVQGYGAFSVRMTDFGIQPPRALLGLVRARNQITVRFNLIGRPEPLAP